MTPDDLFGALWTQYAALTPQAEAIRGLLEARGETVQNDHVAFRTYDHPALGIARMAAPFEALGYREFDTYRFEEKKLFARAYAHEDETQPKVFISELLLDEFSEDLRDRVNALVDQMPDGAAEGPGHLTSGRPWTVDTATYEALAAESEYAGWLAAYGFCANHFTIFVNALTSFDSLEDLAAFIEAEGYAMNDAGGVIKGGPDVLLAQCSTKAARVPCGFADGTLTIPSCYYEFAKRYAGADGTLYQGFVASSADKIFESTDR